MSDRLEQIKNRASGKDKSSNDISWIAADRGWLLKELKRYKKALEDLALEAEEHRFEYETRAGINRDEYWQGRRDEAGHFRDMAREKIAELEEGAADE